MMATRADPVTLLFSSDPKLLVELEKHRLQDPHRVLRRLEAVHKHNGTQQAESLSGETTKELLDKLVYIYVQVSDNIKISRAVEKLWQPFLEKHSQHVYACLEGHVMRMLQCDWSSHQGFTKVSVILEQSHMVQSVFQGQACYIATHMAALLEGLLHIPVDTLSLTQAQCLYAVVKICLQMFQVCATELGTRLWVTGSGNENQLVRTIVENLVLVLCRKGYHSDCVLLCGTAMALVLNTAPNHKLATTVFSHILSCILNGDGKPSFTELCESQPRYSNIMDKLGTITSEQIGAVAIIRGVVACGNEGMLLTTCPHPDSQSLKNTVAESMNDSSKPKGIAGITETKRPKLLMYTLFNYIHTICQGEITLHYHGFQVLLLWYTKFSRLPLRTEISSPSSYSSSHTNSLVIAQNWYGQHTNMSESTSTRESSSISELTSSGESCDDTYVSSVLESTLQLLILHWDSPVEDVPEAVGDIFSQMMSVWSKCKDQIPELPHRVLDILVKTPWYVKGKYRILAALLKFVDVQKVFMDHSEVQSQLLQCLTTNHLASACTAVYKAFLQELVASHNVHSTDRWTNEWMSAVVDGLVSNNSLLRYNTNLHWIPVTLKLLPQTAVSLQHHLVEMMANSATGICHTRLLHAWIVVAKTTRALTGRADLADPHVKESLYSADEDVRSEALAVVCTTLKKSERISDIEVCLLKEAIPHNIKIDSAPFRQHLGSYVRKLLVRLRDSCVTMLKSPDKNKQDLDRALDFVDWLHVLCMRYLIPGASYQRRKGSLDLLQVMYECLIYCPDGRQRKAYTPESAVKLVDFATRSGRWQFFSFANKATFLQCILDGAEEIQSLAYRLLTKYYPWPCDMSHDNMCCHLLEEGLRLCNSPKGHEGQSGAVLCKLVCQKFAMEKGLNLQLSFCEEKSEYTVVVASRTGERTAPEARERSTVGFLDLLLAEIHRCQSEAEKNLVKASKLYPIHGLMSAICQCVTDTEGLWEESVSDLLGLVEKLIDTCHNLVHKMLGIMASVAGQEACPSFAEIGVALERMLLENQSDYTESTSQSPEFQYMLSWCWNNINESCTTLGELTRTVVKFNAPIQPAVLQQICTTFQTVLTKCRHKGVIEGCRNTFVRYCTALFSSDNDALHRIPADILTEVLEDLKNKRMSSSVTRRSAGLPIIIQAVLTSVGKLKKTSLLTSALASLFEICDLPLTDDGGVTDLPQVHGLNILNALFGDANLTPSLVGHTSRAVMLVIQQFGSPSWAVRNAATRLFSTVVTRIFGQKKNTDNSLCNTVTFTEFSSHYPELPPFLLEVLTEASSRDVRMICDLHPGIFPVMTILANLKPMDTNEECVIRELKKFEEKLRPLLASPVYQIRHLVAPAYVAMVTTGRMKEVAVGCLADSVEKEGVITKDLNSMHGKLLLFHSCLDHVSSVSDLEDLWCRLCERVWLASAAVCLVSAQYICCMHRLVQKLPGLSVNQSIIDCVLQKCCNTDAQQIGKGIYGEEGMAFLFTVYRQTGQSVTDLVVTCLASANQDTRRAGLKHLLADREWMKQDATKLRTALCQHLHAEQHIPNLCMTLQLITSLCLSGSDSPPTDTDTTSDWVPNVPLHDCDYIMDWFSQNSHQLPHYTSLAAASLPVKGILIRQWLTMNQSQEYASLITQWCDTVKEFCLQTNETQRMSAILAVQIAGNSLLSHVVGDSVSCNKVLESMRDQWTVSIVSTCLTLIQDEDCEIRTEACKFVSGHKWTSKSVKYSSIHSEVCYELILEYIRDNLWQSKEIVHFLMSLLYHPGEITCLLQEKSAGRYQQLFDQEDNSFFSERIYNAFPVYETLKAVVHHCQTDSTFGVLEPLQEAREALLEDGSVLRLMMQSVKPGSIINICCDNAILASLCGIVLLTNIVAMVTNSCSVTQATNDNLTSSLEDILQSVFKMQVLPPSLQMYVGEVLTGHGS